MTRFNEPRNFLVLLNEILTSGIHGPKPWPKGVEHFLLQRKNRNFGSLCTLYALFVGHFAEKKQRLGEGVRSIVTSELSDDWESSKT